MPGKVKLTLDDGVAVVTLADPGRRNALSKQLSDELAATVCDVLDGGARVLVLAAEPPVFCAGGSLDDLLRRERPLGETYAGFEALAGAPVPTIAAVTGAAIGAGVNLPLACDIVIAGEGATFDPRFLDVGIHPGGGHLWRLARRVGPQGAAALVLCGDSLTGAEAADAGLAWRCLPDDEVLTVALKLARRAAGRSPELVRLTKETLRVTTGYGDAAAAAAVELEAQQWSVEQPHFAETVRALREKIGSRLLSQAAAALGSAPGKLRSAALHQRRHALLTVARRRQHRERGALLRERGGHVADQGAAVEAAALAVAERRSHGEAAGQLGGGLLHVLVGHEPVDRAPAVQVGGGDGVA
jgi:enoyl-CoA hydratase